LPPLSELVIEAGIDPAISKNDSAGKSAIVVAGQVRRGLNRGRIYVLAAVAGHWSVYETVGHLLKLVTRWKIRTVRVEDVAYQKALGDVLDHEARQRGITVHVELVKPDTDKLRRALAWSPFVENATVVFGADQKELIEAMLAVPMDASKWDLVDAAGLVIRGFPAMQGEAEPIPGLEFSTPDRAKGYATRIEAPPVPPRTNRPCMPFMQDPNRRRAAGYAVRAPERAGPHR
jgi:predicted phage terminase large subunit-like protein